MTDITDSESQAIWDKHRKAPHIDTFEEFKKKKEPEKKGWLSRQLSGIGSSYATALEAEASAEPMYQGMIENVPALAAGFATLPFHAWGVLENALRGRGGEGQIEHYPDIKPSAPFHLPVGTSLMDTGMTPEQLAQAVQSRVYQPQSEEGQQIQERIAQGGDFLNENIIRPVSRFVASVMPGDYLENLADQLLYGRLVTLNPKTLLGKSATAVKEGPNVMRDFASGIELSRRGQLGPRTLAAMNRAKEFMAKWGETDRAFSDIAKKYANSKDLNDILATGEWNWYMGTTGKLMGLAKMPVESISNLFKKGDPYYKYMEEEIGVSANSLLAMEKLASQIDTKRAKPTSGMSKDEATAHRSEINALARQLTQQPVYSFLIRRMYSPDHHSVQPGSQLHNYYKQLYHDEVVGKPSEIVTSDTFRQATGMEHLKPELLDEMVGMVSDSWGLQKQRFGRDLRIGGVREFEASGNLHYTMQFDKQRHYNHVKDVWLEARRNAGDNWNGITAKDFINLLQKKDFYRGGLKVKDSSTPGHILIQYSTTTGNELLGGINVVARVNTKDGGVLILGSDKLDILGKGADIAFGLGKNEDFLSVIFKDASFAKAADDAIFPHRDWYSDTFYEAQALMSMAAKARAKGGKPDLFENDGYWYGGYRDANGNRVTRSTGLRVDDNTQTAAKGKVDEWARDASESFRRETQDIADIYPVAFRPPTSGKPAVINPAFDPSGKSSSAFPYIPWKAYDRSKAGGATRDLSLLGGTRSAALESMEDALRGWTGRKTDTWRTGEIPESYNLRQRELEDYLSRISLAGQVALPGLLQEREF